MSPVSGGYLLIVKKNLKDFEGFQVLFMPTRFQLLYFHPLAALQLTDVDVQKYQNDHRVLMFIIISLMSV